MLSGDGTIHEVVNGMLNSENSFINSGNIPILPLPAGSSNSI